MTALREASWVLEADMNARLLAGLVHDKSLRDYLARCQREGWKTTNLSVQVDVLAAWIKALDEETAS